MSVQLIAGAGLLFAAVVASAHSVDAARAASADRWLTTSQDAWLAVVPIAVAALLYGIGWIRLFARAAVRGPHVRRAVLFGLGIAALWIALLTRLDTLGSELFSAHMLQHETLMLIAAPLLVLGRPLPVFVWAFRPRARRAIGGAIRSRAFAQCWHCLSRPAVAWALHAAALWAWHAPPLFDAALVHAGVHDLQHQSFLLTALLFWSSLLSSRQTDGLAVLYLFTTTMHTSVLGALLTFASHPLYAAYLTTTSRWNLTPLEDQQLGGLIMWVPGSLVYVALALALLSRWLAQAPFAYTAGACTGTRAR